MIINSIKQKLLSSPLVKVAWLYGSRATGQFSEQSDYDIAVALGEAHGESALLDDLQYELSNELEVAVSIIDINAVPVPLAINVISDGKVIINKNDLRLRSEQQRIWSLWEEYKYQYERYRN